MAAVLRSSSCVAAALSRPDARPAARQLHGGGLGGRPRRSAPARGAPATTRLAAARPDTLVKEVEADLPETSPSLQELAAALEAAVER